MRRIKNQTVAYRESDRTLYVGDLLGTTSFYTVGDERIDRRGRSGRSTRLLIVTLLLASTLTIMVDTVISPALPAMQTHFADVDRSDLLVRLVLVFPSVFVALGAPIVGALVDRVDRKPVLAVSATLYGLAGGAGYLLESIPALLASRALLGIGAAGVFVTSTTLIVEYFPDEEMRDTVLGWQGAVVTFGGAVFVLLGGLLTGLGWHAPFLVYASALALVPLVLFVLYEPTGPDTKPPVNGPDESIRHLVERLPLGTLVLVNWVALIGMIVFFMVPVEVPFYLTAVVGADSVLVGIAVAVSAVTSALVATQYSRLRARVGVIPIAGLKFVLIGAGFGIVSFGSTVPIVLFGLAVTGTGIGLLLPNLNSWIATAVPSDVRGRAFGSMTSSMYLGQFLSPFASTPAGELLGLRLTFRLGGAMLIGLGLVFLVYSSVTRTAEAGSGGTEFQIEEAGAGEADDT